MNKGCFGSYVVASEVNEVCLACPDKPLCHEKVKETLKEHFGAVEGFPIDNIGKRRKSAKAKNT